MKNLIGQDGIAADRMIPRLFRLSKAEILWNIPNTTGLECVMYVFVVEFFL